MHKVNLLGRKLSLINVLSLVLMVMGIGCITGVIFSMWEQSNYSVNATYSSYSRPTALVARLNKLTGDRTDPMNFDYLSTHPNQDKTFLPSYPMEGVNLELDPNLVLPTPDKSLYSVYPKEGENIGILTIPALNRKLPILQGTGANELKKGVGHFAQSVLPGEDDNCVFSGHRETAFKQIGVLKIGDMLIVQTSAGIFTYEINGMRVVHEDDKTVIVPTDHAVLTMTTCYPFNAIGHAPDRYIVSATLVESMPYPSN